MIRGLGAYAVDRRGSATAAIKRSLQVLQAGGAVGIFPEGTRNPHGDVQPQTGVALLAVAGEGPGGSRLHRAAATGRCNWAEIEVAFGTPLALAAGRKATRDDLAKFTGEIMTAIEALAGSIGGNT